MLGFKNKITRYICFYIITPLTFIVSIGACSIDYTSLSLSPYNQYSALTGDLHIHSSTASYDAKNCSGVCRSYSAMEQLNIAKESGLDFAAVTEHLRNPFTESDYVSQSNWQKVISSVKEFERDEEFTALYGYEWSGTNSYCYNKEKISGDYGHKVIILPPNVQKVCLFNSCSTPDQLTSFMESVGAIGFTAHPWRIKILSEHDALPPYLNRNYFASSRNTHSDVWIGAEVGPDFEPLSGPEWEYPLVCGSKEIINKRQATLLPEWVDALKAGKRMGAISTSDRHFSYTPFGLRTTVIFAVENSYEGIMQALKSRRTMSAFLKPFELEFYSGLDIVGGNADRKNNLIVSLNSGMGEVKKMKLRSVNKIIASWAGDEAVGQHIIAASNLDIGPVWVEVMGHEIHEGLKQPRMTITSPIWIN